MFSLSKKETPIANIAFMSIMAAINVIFALLMAFIPYIMFLLILILPMTSVLVALYCQKRYYPLYIIVTLGLCFVSAIWDVSITIFYILPSMITGFLFALFLKIKLPNIYLIVIPSIIQLLFNYLGIYISFLITKVNIIETMQIALRLQDFEYYNVIVPSFIILVSLLQSLFSYMIIKDELPKFGYQIYDDNETLFYANIIITLDLLTICLVTGILQILIVAYPCLILASVFAISLCINAIKDKSKITIILNAVSLAITIIIFGVCFKYFIGASAFLIFGLFYFLTTIIAIINKTLLIKSNCSKIDNSSK